MKIRELIENSRFCIFNCCFQTSNTFIMPLQRQLNFHLNIVIQVKYSLPNGKQLFRRDQNAPRMGVEEEEKRGEEEEES